jgi:hypothetical protein
MAIDTPSATQLSQVISQVTAPSFLLGAVAAFVSVLIGRMNRTIDRLEALSAVSDDDTSKGHLRTDIPHLKRRAVLLNRAIVFSTILIFCSSLIPAKAFLVPGIFAFGSLMYSENVASSQVADIVAEATEVRFGPQAEVKPGQVKENQSECVEWTCRMRMYGRTDGAL